MQKHYHDYWKDETPEWIDFMKTSPEKRSTTQGACKWY